MRFNCNHKSFPIWKFCCIHYACTIFPKKLYLNKQWCLSNLAKSLLYAHYIWGGQDMDIISQELTVLPLQYWPQLFYTAMQCRAGSDYLIVTLKHSVEAVTTVVLCSLQCFFLISGEIMVKIGDLELHPPVWSRIYVPEGNQIVELVQPVIPCHTLYRGPALV